MRFHRWQSPFLVLLLTLSLAPLPIAAQAGGDSSLQAKRQKAEDLFAQGKRLEALPLLEEVVRGNPKDDQMLVALAACLVEHASTLPDESAAAKERFRARDLLDQAWNLGNNSTLAQNLAQLLKQLPESGVIKFSDNAAVQQVMVAGEAAFSRRDFDEALKDYAKALELEPANYSAALFIGNTYDRKNDFAKAEEWYKGAIQLDPNVETAYRYFADMLAKHGEMAQARTMLIRAAVAEPYNKIVWRELHAWATINHTDINFVYAGIAPDPRDTQAQIKLNPQQIPEIPIAWNAYRAVKAKWQESEFKKRFPGETEYRHTLKEESEALVAEATALEKLKEDKKTAELLSKNEALSLLLRLYEGGFIESYVLFSLGDPGVARDYAAYRAKNRAKLEDYMDKFVVPPALAR